MFKKFFTNRRARLATRRGLFYFEQAGTRVVCDPLLTYCALKEIGLDQLDEQLNGLKTGDPAKTRAFVASIRTAFNVDHVTAYDLARLYRYFIEYLADLKKNASLLRDFAPDLEARRKRLSETFDGGLISAPPKQPLDSSRTEPKAAPSSDLATTTEPTGPSTVII